jgi:hypothetical protein
VSGEYPQDALFRSQWICANQYPLDPNGHSHGLLSPEQLHYAYAYLIERSVPCLEGHGYDVGVPPSEDAFASVDQGLANWSPYWAIVAGSQSQGEVASATAVCPPPPVAYDWAPGPFG